MNNIIPLLSPIKHEKRSKYTNNIKVKIPARLHTLHIPGTATNVSLFEVLVNYYTLIV